MTAARILGIGRTKAYELARHGEFPCRVIRIGDLYRVSTADLLRLLGVSATNVDAPRLSPSRRIPCTNLVPDLIPTDTRTPHGVEATEGRVVLNAGAYGSFTV